MDQKHILNVWVNTVVIAKTGSLGHRGHSQKSQVDLQVSKMTTMVDENHGFLGRALLCAKYWYHTCNCILSFTTMSCDRYHVQPVLSWGKLRHLFKVTLLGSDEASIHTWAVGYGTYPPIMGLF